MSTWIDKVSDIFYEKNIILAKEEKKPIVSRNKTIMVYAIDYVQEKALPKIVLKQINFVQMKKEVYLLYELIGANGRTVTEVYYDIQMKSQIRWGFYSHINEKINKSQGMI